MSTPGIENAVLRPMRASDVSSAFDLSSLIGWNQTVEDWAMLFELAGKGCLAIEVDRRLVSTTTLLCYGRQLAWIGMVLTHPEFRRHGLARKVLVECLKRADQLGIKTLKLDATEQGQPLYESLGFRTEQPIERWARPGSDVPPRFVSNSADPSWLNLDSHCFGVDRQNLLRHLALRSFSLFTGEAYLLARRGRLSTYLGPAVGIDDATAGELITQTVTNSTCSWVWDLFPGNRRAAALATELGFAPQRHLLRMYRGKELSAKTNAIYAIAGFELG